MQLAANSSKFFLRPGVELKIQITVEWMIRSTNCIEEYVRMNSKTVSWYYANPELRLPEGGHGKYQKYKETIQCSDTSLQDHYKDPWKDVNHDIEQIEQEIQPYVLKVRKITVSGADFLDFEACWRCLAAAEAGHRLHTDSNQMDLSGRLLDFTGFFK